MTLEEFLPQPLEGQRAGGEEHEGDFGGPGLNSRREEDLPEDDARCPLVVGQLPVGLGGEPVAHGGRVMLRRVVVGPDDRDGDERRDGERPHAPPRGRSRAGQRRGLHVARRPPQAAREEG